MNADELFREYSILDDRYIFRFRPYSAISLKELMYGEMYFSYDYELNDPFDHKKNLIINEKNVYVTNFLIFSALRGIRSLSLDKIDINNTLNILSLDIVNHKINILDLELIRK